MPHPSAFCAQGWDSTTANPLGFCPTVLSIERPKISPERDTGNRTAVSLTGSNGLDPLTCCSTTSPTARQFRGDEPTRRRLLLAKIAEAASAGVDYIQLREKDLSTRDLQSLAENSFAPSAKREQQRPTANRSPYQLPHRRRPSRWRRRRSPPLQRRLPRGSPPYLGLMWRGPRPREAKHRGVLSQPRRCGPC